MRVVCYARVARMEQLGIEAQKEYVRNYIKGHLEWGSKSSLSMELGRPLNSLTIYKG